MNWEKQLFDYLEMLGSNPTLEQLERLESWVRDNVPPASWGSIAFHLPGVLATDFRMYAAECGE